MKQNNHNSPIKDLIIPVTAGLGLAYFAQQMVSDVQSSGASMTTAMWCAVALMAAGSIYALFTAWKRWQARPKAEQPEPEEQAAAPAALELDPIDAQDLSPAAEAMARLITGNHTALKCVTAEKFEDCFQSYRCQCGPVLDCLTQYEGDEAAMSHLATLTLDRLSAGWSRQPDMKDQMVTAIYFVPALRYEDHTAGVEFTDCFHALWCQRYPMSPFEIGSYEGIQEGFRKKGLFGSLFTKN